MELKILSSCKNLKKITIQRICTALSTSFMCLCWVSPVSADPVGGNIVGSSATISQSNLTTINQNTSASVISWSAFDVSSSEVVNFNQPSTSSIALSRIGVNPPVSHGTLTSLPINRNIVSKDQKMTLIEKPGIKSKIQNGEITIVDNQVRIDPVINQVDFSKALNAGEMVHSTNVTVNEDGTFLLSPEPE